LKRPCSEGCGRSTKEKSGVCVICRKFNIDMSDVLKGRARDVIKENMHDKNNDGGDNIMSFVTEIKTCIDCRKEYNPTSNVQKRCPDCGVLHKMNKKREKPVKKNRLPPPAPVSQTNSASAVRKKDETFPENSNPVDLTVLPISDKRVTEICEEEVRFMIRRKLGVLCLMLAVILCLITAPAFAADVVLSYNPPTQNVDGTPVTDLAGYKIYYGTISRTISQTYDEIVDVGDVTTYKVSGLNEGTYYFAVTAYDTSGNESDFSAELPKTIKIPPMPPELKGATVVIVIP